jgi:hypothetical protein
LFIGIRLSEADDAAANPAIGPDQDDHSTIQKPDRDHPPLAVVEAIIDMGDVATGEHLARSGEIEPPPGESQLPLSLIILDVHFL